MSKYSVEDIVRDVRIAIDQNGSDTQLLLEGDEETLQLDELIRSKIEDAAYYVESKAPLYLIDNGEFFGDTIYWYSAPGIGGGFIELPKDFMRLIVFEMSDWTRAVSEAITEDSPLYALQKSRYGGIRGNYQNPVVAITRSATGFQLEFYSCGGGEDVSIKRALYLPKPKIKSSEIDLSDKLYRAVVYYCAYLVSVPYGA